MNMDINTEKNSSGDRFIINSDYKELLKYNDLKTAESLWNMRGESVKNIRKSRGTEKIILKNQKNAESITAYIKRYKENTVTEKIKTFFSSQPCIFDAFDEWKSILLFHKNKLNTMIPLAVGEYEGNTCNLTLGIENYTRASELFANFAESDTRRKRKLIEKIASYAERMHSAELAHQDFYLLHFFVKEDEDDEIYLIDLQRVIKPEKFSERWRIKDLAQLLFSSEKFLSEKEILRFWILYCRNTDRNLLRNKSTVKAIRRRAEKILNREKRKS